MKRGSALEMVGGIITRSHFLHPHISFASWRCGDFWMWLPGSARAVVPWTSTASTTGFPLDSAVVEAALGLDSTVER